jgi:NAD(P)-dependent dehydrogenase (short-subunit alcohol dehydrogenase family)
MEVAETGITVNCILPGSVFTPMLGFLTEEQVMDEARRIPLGRWGMPADIAGVAAFFASDSSSWITGAALCVDGGLMSRMGRGAPEDVRRHLGAEAAYLQSGDRRLPGQSRED